MGPPERRGVVHRISQIGVAPSVKQDMRKFTVIQPGCMVEGGGTRLVISHIGVDPEVEEKSDSLRVAPQRLVQYRIVARVALDEPGLLIEGGLKILHIPPKRGMSNADRRRTVAEQEVIYATRPPEPGHVDRCLSTPERPHVLVAEAHVLMGMPGSEPCIDRGRISVDDPAGQLRIIQSRCEKQVRGGPMRQQDADDIRSAPDGPHHRRASVIDASLINVGAALDEETGYDAVPREVQGSRSTGSRLVDQIRLGVEKVLQLLRPAQSRCGMNIDRRAARNEMLGERKPIGGARFEESMQSGPGPAFPHRPGIHIRSEVEQHVDEVTIALRGCLAERLRAEGEQRCIEDVPEPWMFLEKATHPFGVTHLDRRTEPSDHGIVSLHTILLQAG